MTAGLRVALRNAQMMTEVEDLVSITVRAQLFKANDVVS